MASLLMPFTHLEATRWSYRWKRSGGLCGYFINNFVPELSPTSEKVFGSTFMHVLQRYTLARVCLTRGFLLVTRIEWQTRCQLNLGRDHEQSLQPHVEKIEAGS
jgi:hypothetical protein